MRRAILPLVIALALTTTGCGDDMGNHGADAKPRSGPTAQSVGECAPDSATVRQATAVGAFDLDGDGTRDQLFVTAPTAPCPDTLFAALGDGYAALALAEPLAPKSFAGVKLTGHDGAVVRADAVHPRGGFQAHLYGYADGELAELTVDGEPVFPFVATDSLSTPVSAACTDTGFQVTRADPHQPLGAAAGWDLSRTDYTVSGNRLTAGATTRVEQNVLPAQLRKRHRAMLDYSLFANCPAT